jgi:serine/threonine protein kinase
MAASTLPPPPPERSRPDPLIGTPLGPYTLESRIGEGGLGRVYLGVQPDIGLRVAVKVLGTTDAPPPDGFVERFQKEAQALARVSHPNVVRILGYSAGPPFPYLVMEIVEGAAPLNAFLVPETARPLAIHLLRQLLFALEAVHAAQVVHRDLKPSNILVQSVPGEPHLLRLLDFGLAKFLEGGHQTRLAGGTPAYMAPEQMSSSQPVGPATDLYAVGVLAAELLTGRRVFGRMAESDILRLKRQANFKPRALIEDAPMSPALAAVIDRATAFDPATRFPDAPSLRAALEAALGASGARPVPEAEPPRSARVTRVEAGRRGGTRVEGSQPSLSLPTVDPGPPEPSSIGSRPVVGALEPEPAPTTAPHRTAPEERPADRRALGWWVVAGVAAAGMLTALIAMQEPTVVSGARTPTLPPPRLLGEDHLPTVAQVRPRAVVEAVPVESATPPARPLLSAPPTQASPPSNPPSAPPRPARPAAAVASARPATPPPARPAIPPPARPAVPPPDPEAALRRARAALARCDCALARADLAGVSDPPPAYTRALAACRLPMLGQQCAPPELP